MKFQLRTHSPLCKSKKYFNTYEEILEHIRKVVKCTELFRKKMRSKDLKYEGFGLKVTDEETQLGITLMKLDGKEEAYKILAEQVEEISDPFQYPYETKKTNRISKNQNLTGPKILNQET